MNANAEKLIDKYFPVLDKGFVALKDVMGTEEDIEAAARTSYGKGTRKKSETRGLLRYLLRHRHTTPFEMAEMKFHIGIPMDAWRQFIRHRTANVNEYSTRYSEAIDAKQETSPDQWRLQSGSNKQGSGGFLTDDSEWPQSYLDAGVNPINSITGYLSQSEKDFHHHADVVYKSRLEFGIAREQARKDLPLSTYTMAYWKCDLHNILHFLSLRCDSHAQLEIRSYANVMLGMVKECFPSVYEAFIDYRLGACTFSRMERQLIPAYVAAENEAMLECDLDGGDLGLNFVAKELGMSDREVQEFKQKMAFINFDDSQYTLDLSQAQTAAYFEGLYNG